MLQVNFMSPRHKTDLIFGPRLGPCQLPRSATLVQGWLEKCRDAQSRLSRRYEHPHICMPAQTNLRRHIYFNVRAATKEATVSHRRHFYLVLHRGPIFTSLFNSRNDDVCTGKGGCYCYILTTVVHIKKRGSNLVDRTLGRGGRGNIIIS